jgi:hypothetical protein
MMGCLPFSILLEVKSLSALIAESEAAFSKMLILSQFQGPINMLQLLWLLPHAGSGQHTAASLAEEVLIKSWWCLVQTVLS